MRRSDRVMGRRFGRGTERSERRAASEEGFIAGGAIVVYKCLFLHGCAVELGNLKAQVGKNIGRFLPKFGEFSPFSSSNSPAGRGEKKYFWPPRSSNFGANGEGKGTEKEHLKEIDVFRVADSLLAGPHFPGLRGCKIQVNIVEDSSLNAWAQRQENELNIGVHRGVLSYLNLDELEALLAHEFTHTAERHTEKSPSQALPLLLAASAAISFPWLKLGAVGLGAAAYFLSSKLSPKHFSRRCEYEADAVAAKVNREGLISLLGKLGEEKQKWWGIFDTHPPVWKRIEAAEKI